MLALLPIRVENATRRSSEENALPPPEPEPPPSTVRDEFDDEYLCPYCAVPTEPQDRRCKACGGNLLINVRREEKRSKWLWVAVALQVLTAIGMLVNTVSLLMFSPTMPTSTGLFVNLALFPLSLAILVGLYLRWKPAFYLFLIDAGLGLLLVIVSILRSLSSPASDIPLFGGVNYICSGFNILLSLAMLWVAFQIQDDFAFDRQRILLRPDSNVGGASLFLARGHEYARRKTWGLAALHMRRAVAFMPDQMSGRPALILTYLKLKRYDLAAQALAEARRISPDDPRVAELQTLLDDSRSADNSPQRT